MNGAHGQLLAYFCQQDQILHSCEHLESLLICERTGVQMHCGCRDHSVPDGLDYVAAYNAAMLPSSDIQEVFKAVIKERRRPRFSKL